jgi:sulfonate transport system permease protein
MNAVARPLRMTMSASAFLCLIALWQVLSIVYTTEILPGEPMVPGWQVVFTSTLLSLANYWQGGLGVPTVADGAQKTYLMAMLSILANSLDTWGRPIAGLAAGGLVGSLLGLAVSWSPWSRRIVSLPLQFLRVLPLLAMVPLFQLWFGIGFLGKITFVGYGVGVIVFTAIVNAVGNVSKVYLDNARTMGATRFQLYKTIILPSILPEMQSAILLSLGAAWGTVLGAEYLGAQTGLGYIIVYSESFGYLDRMFLIALVIIVYASASFWAVKKLVGHLTRWSRSRR